MCKFEEKAKQNIIWSIYHTLNSSLVISRSLVSNISRNASTLLSMSPGPYEAQSISTNQQSQEVQNIRDLFQIPSLWIG